MRIETYTREVFTLDEVREKAIEKNWYINVDYDWYQHTYDDADTVGIEITGFDIGRGSYCTGNVGSPTKTAELIIKNHGPACDTYKLAENFLTAQKPLKDREAILDRLCDNYCTSHRYHKFYKELNDVRDEIEELQEEFKKGILDEYLWMLKKEYEYLLSDDAVYDTLQNYEFNKEGEIV